MFLLYNEYFPVDLLKYALSSMGNENDTEKAFSLNTGKFEENLIGIINYSGRLLGTFYSSEEKYEQNIYSHIKYDFFRNYVTTLTFKHYESDANYNTQMSVIYSSLTHIEKSFLKDYLFIDNDTVFCKLVRKQIDDYTIDLAEVEKYDSSFEDTYGDTIDSDKMEIKDTNYKYADIEHDGYYKIQKTDSNDYVIVETKRNDTEGRYLLCNYRIVYPKGITDIKSSSCLLYGTPSIVNLSSILNLTNINDSEYYYYYNGEQYSKRDLLRSILNKISLGTIHY